MDARTCKQKGGIYNKKTGGCNTGDYKQEIYKGHTITFTKMHGGMVGARIPKRTSQYLGIGKGKTKAFEDIKKLLDQLNE